MDPQVCSLGFTTAAFANTGRRRHLTNAPPQRALWKVVRQDLEGALVTSEEWHFKVQWY